MLPRVVISASVRRRNLVAPIRKTLNTMFFWWRRGESNPRPTYFHFDFQISRIKASLGYTRYHTTMFSLRFYSE